MERYRVERIEMPSNERFERDYLRPLKPVVITNLFAGEPVREIRTKADAIAKWGEVPVQIQLEYGEALFGKAGAGTSEEVSLARYFDFVREHPNTRKMVIEFLCPEQVQSAYRVPEVCLPRDDDSHSFRNQCFIGNKGNVAGVHFDKGGTHGFLYQVFGRKRFLMFPHGASEKLSPYTQLGGWQLEQFSDADRQAFLEFTGGIEILLEPGECAFVPCLCWHFADYVEDSMAISLRFRRPGYLTPLLNLFFPDDRLQGIAHKLRHSEHARTEYGWLLAEVERAGSLRFGSGKEQVAYARELARELYYRLYPSAPRERYMLDLERVLPSPIPHFLDASDPARPLYR
jgi:lysine-specific demethylase 8